MLGLRSSTYSGTTSGFPNSLSSQAQEEYYLFPIAGGIGPDKWFWLRSKACRAFNLPMDEGMDPTNEVQLNKAWGILPLRKLFPKSRISRLPRLPSSDGIGPEREFPKSVSSRRCEQSPNWGGILPVKKFKVRSRTWRFERFPMEGEISPFNCMSMREMLTTRVDKGSHVTPVQLQCPFASSFQSTRLPKGSSRIEALKAFMASTSTSKLLGSPGRTIMSKAEDNMASAKHTFCDIFDRNKNTYGSKLNKMAVYIEISSVLKL
nr:hypothetical protein BRARA_C03424 [Ipomoea trifida]